MFCRKCGIKLNMDEKNCRNCGAIVDTAEYCNGFWDLVGVEKKRPVVAPVLTKSSEGEAVAEKLPARDPGKAVASPQGGAVAADSKGRNISIWHVICLVLLILLLIQSGKASHYAQKYGKIQTQYESLKEQCETVTSQKEELEAKIDVLIGDLEQINAVIAEVKEAIAAEQESAEQPAEETVDNEENVDAGAAGESSDPEGENG